MSAELALASHPVEGAAELARYLVESRLAACVQVLPGATSVYRWKDSVHQETEALLLVKYPQANRKRLMEAVLSRHPYEVPEILFFTATDGLPAYLEWLAREAGSEAGR